MNVGVYSYGNLTYFLMVSRMRKLVYIDYNSVASSNTVASVTATSMGTWYKIACDAYRCSTCTVVTIINAGHHHPRRRATGEIVPKDMDIWNESVGQHGNYDAQSGAGTFHQAKIAVVVWILKDVCDLNSTRWWHLWLRQNTLIFWSLYQCCMFTWKG